MHSSFITYKNMFENKQTTMIKYVTLILTLFYYCHAYV